MEWWQILLAKRTAKVRLPGPTQWTEPMRIELWNLFHLGRAAARGGRYEAKLWASKRFSEIHPEVSSTAAYKEMCREEAWRYCEP